MTFICLPPPQVVCDKWIPTFFLSSSQILLFAFNVSVAVKDHYSLSLLFSMALSFHFLLLAFPSSMSIYVTDIKIKTRKIPRYCPAVLSSSLEVLLNICDGPALSSLASLPSGRLSCWHIYSYSIIRKLILLSIRKSTHICNRVLMKSGIWHYRNTARQAKIIRYLIFVFTLQKAVFLFLKKIILKGSIFLGWMNKVWQINQ